MSSDSSTKHVFLTGPPAIGKSTTIQRTLELLSDVRVAGFYTEEVREDDRRTGFEIIGLSTGHRTMLASQYSDSNLKLRRFGIELPNLEEIVNRELRASSQPQLFVIDEIGKIQLYSELFIETVNEILDGMTPVLGTVALYGGGLIEETKQRRDTNIIEVGLENRDGLPSQIVDQLRTVIE